MPIFFSVSYEGLAVFAKRRGVAVKTSNAAIRFANFAVANYWHQHILPRHFSRGNKRRYHHQRRKYVYSKIKRLKAQGRQYTDPQTGKTEHEPVVKGGTVDLAYKGSSERKARSTRAIRVSKNGFVIKLVVPRYIVIRRRGNYPNMKREIQTTTLEESKEMRKVFWTAYRHFITSNRVVEGK